MFHHALAAKSCACGLGSRGACRQARAFAWPVGGRRRQTTIAKRWPVIMGPRFSRAFAGTTELVARVERSEIRDQSSRRTRVPRIALRSIRATQLMSLEMCAFAGATER